MLGWLQTIVDWIFGRASSLVQLSLQAPNTYGASRNRWEGPDPPKRPYDPDSPVRSPRWYGPTGRSASVAVAEPVDDESLVLVGGPHSVSGKSTEPAPPDGADALNACLFDHNRARLWTVSSGQTPQ